MSSCVKARKPKARENYLCDSCGNVIDVGETYHRMVMIHEGFYTYRQCLPCGQAHRFVWAWAGEPETGIDWPHYMDWACEVPTLDPPAPEDESNAARAYRERVGVKPEDLPDPDNPLALAGKTPATATAGTLKQ